jgi:GTP-binding protein HflX
VLGEIGADQVPQVLVFNKLDAMDQARRPLQLNDMFEVNDPISETPRRLERVFVSAQTGEGLPLLRQVLSRYAGNLSALDNPAMDEAVGALGTMSL